MLHLIRRKGLLVGRSGSFSDAPVVAGLKRMAQTTLSGVVTTAATHSKSVGVQVWLTACCAVGCVLGHTKCKLVFSRAPTQGLGKYYAPIIMTQHYAFYCQDSLSSCYSNVKHVTLWNESEFW